jgi:hypothetical protein
MPKGLSGKLAGMVRRTRKAGVEGDATRQPAAIATEPAAGMRHPRVGLWVLATFAVVAATVSITAAVIGPANADTMVVVPLALCWAVAVSLGFALRSALINVIRSMAPRKEEVPDATMERLSRMVRSEQKREATHPPGRPLLHVAA